MISISFLFLHRDIFFRVLNYPPLIWTGWFLLFWHFLFFLFCVRFLYQDLNSLFLFFLFGLVYPFWYSTSSSRLLRNWYKWDFSFSRVLTHLEMLISYNTFNIQVGNYSPQNFESIIPLAFSKGMASINVEKSDAILIHNLLWSSFFFLFWECFKIVSLSLVFES